MERDPDPIHNISLQSCKQTSKSHSLATSDRTCRTDHQMASYSSQSLAPMADGVREGRDTMSAFDAVIPNNGKNDTVSLLNGRNISVLGEKTTFSFLFFCTAAGKVFRECNRCCCSFLRSPIVLIAKRLKTHRCKGTHEKRFNTYSRFVFQFFGTTG